METKQLTELKNWIKNIQNVQLDEIISAVFVNQDINSIMIGTMNVEDYIKTFNRLFRQFEEELEENGKYLPISYNFHNEFGSGNLSSDFQNIHSLISSKNQANLNNSVSYINRLVYYQIVNGFWDKSLRKTHKPIDIKSNELYDELNYISKQLKENFKNFQDLVKSLEEEKKKLQDFISQKNQELQQITNNLQTSNSHTNQISQLLNSSTSTNEKINSILTQQNQLIENQKKKAEAQDDYFVKQKESFDKIEATLNEKIKTVESLIQEFQEHLSFIENKREYFEERNNYLTDLIGREVGASLFETFKQRKVELEKPVNKWSRIVVAMAFLTFIAIITIFTNAFGYFGDIPDEISIIRLIANSIKTLPFFFLLFYSITQYNKERNFQEEYAFKSAVALTIKAYSDIVKKEELKDELIVNSVSGVYKPPTLVKTRKTKEESGILETARELISTAIEVMKKK